jgi:hypothetical protein
MESTTIASGATSKTVDLPNTWDWNHTFIQMSTSCGGNKAYICCAWVETVDSDTIKFSRYNGGSGTVAVMNIEYEICYHPDITVAWYKLVTTSTTKYQAIIAIDQTESFLYTTYGTNYYGYTFRWASFDFYNDTAVRLRKRTGTDEITASMQIINSSYFNCQEVEGRITNLNNVQAITEVNLSTAFCLITNCYSTGYSPTAGGAPSEQTARVYFQDATNVKFEASNTQSDSYYTAHVVDVGGFNCTGNCTGGGGSTNLQIIEYNLKLGTAIVFMFFAFVLGAFVLFERKKKKDKKDANQTMSDE